MSTSSNNTSFKNLKQSLDLTYASPPDCECFIQAQIRVVESERKPSKGRLIPVTFPSGDLFSGAEEEVEDDDEVVCGVSRVVGSQRQEMRAGLFPGVLATAIVPPEPDPAAAALIPPDLAGVALVPPELLAAEIHGYTSMNSSPCSAF
ncbi:hypothetical protein BUALT_Bualt04G0053300 [Buddleja alternifolia]|uniref:Uncharacterized protein n=1 Tax=Buddleja alternifolia TaxID=168488 RepID=A0AAV6XT08_9LAMI|nr:hypothetical protein BUALT_Bualt04G0053300 [Buddleja alternifolia]